jgi:phage-related protein
MSQDNKPLVWLHGAIKTPPFSQSARLEAGFLLRQLQQGDSLGMPYSRAMSTIGTNCHELRLRDADQNWRIMYRIDDDAILILEVFSKKSQATPKTVIDICKKRLIKYDQDKQD